MTTLRELLGKRAPILAASFTDRDLGITPQALMQSGLDVAELRIDLFSSWNEEHVKSIATRFPGLATIATIRSASEGGRWRGTDQDRLRLFRLLVTDVDALDIELNAGAIAADVIRYANENDKLAILSYHNFELTPDLSDLTALLGRANALGAHLFKVASYVRGYEDLQVLAEFTIQNARKHQLVTIGVGAMGMMSRIFFPALGSRITFSSAGESTAPGQLGVSRTFELLRTFYPEYNQQKISELELTEFV